MHRLFEHVKFQICQNKTNILNYFLADKPQPTRVTSLVVAFICKVGVFVHIYKCFNKVFTIETNTTVVLTKVLLDTSLLLCCFVASSKERKLFGDESQGAWPPCVSRSHWHSFIHLFTTSSYWVNLSFRVNPGALLHEAGFVLAVHCKRLTFV